MAEPFPTPAEVDAMLEGVTPTSPSAGPEPAAAGVREFDLANAERVLSGRLDALDLVNERFVRDLRVGLFRLLRRQPEVTVRPVSVVRYSAFLDSIVLPASLNVISLTPLRGAGLLIFDPQLVLCAVDLLFGGTGERLAKLEGRDFSPAEKRIIGRLIDLALADYARAWEPLYRLRLVCQRSEMHRQFVDVAGAGDNVVVSSFDIDLGAAAGQMHFCLPQASLDPIRDVLNAPPPGEVRQADRDWLRKLTEQLQSAEVELTADLAHKRITIGQLLKLKAGDVIDLAPPEIITAHVDGLPVLDCRFGTINGRTAIRVERLRK